jgi:hypothetical protein
MPTMGARWQRRMETPEELQGKLGGPPHLLPRLQADCGVNRVAQRVHADREGALGGEDLRGGRGGGPEAGSLGGDPGGGQSGRGP